MTVLSSMLNISRDHIYAEKYNLQWYP